MILHSHFWFNHFPIFSHIESSILHGFHGSIFPSFRPGGALVRLGQAQRGAAETLRGLGADRSLSQGDLRAPWGEVEGGGDGDGGMVKDTLW